MDAGDRDRIVLAGVVATVLLSQVLLYPGLPELLPALGAGTAFDASMWFLGVEFTAYVVFAGVWGALSDVLGRRAPLVTVSAAGGAVGYLALAALPHVGSASFAAVLVVRALQGAMTIGALSLSMTVLMDLPGGHGRNMGAAGIAIGTGVAVGAPVGGQLTAVDPLAPLVVAGGLLAVVAVASLPVVDRVPDTDRGGVREVLASVGSTPALTIPYAFGFIDRLTAGFFAFVGTFYFQESFGLDAAATGLTLALFFAPFALLQYPFGVLSDHVGRRLPVVGGSICYGLAVAGVGLAGSLWLAQAGLVVVGVLGALMAPATMALVTDLAGADQRGAAMGGFNIAGSLGFLAGVVLGGTVRTAYGFPAAFVAVGAVEVAVALVAVGPLLRVDLPIEDRFRPG